MIKILGAGISGLTAAINLAKAGEGVIVYEKCPYVGGKINPNLQVFENWVTTEDVLEKLNEIGIRINFSVPFRKIVVWSPGLKNKAEIIGDTKPVCYGVIRGGKRSFEFELAKQAKKCGAKIVTNFKRKVKPNIDASGSKRADGIAYGKVFKGKFDSNELIGFFDYRYAPKGYLYIFPHSRRIATIGIATRPHQNPQLLLQKALSEIPILKEIVSNSEFLHEFSGCANFQIPKTAILKGTLLVGEAAGFQDAAFGAGMRYAIYSGYLAAKSIVERKNYDDLWKKAFLHELQKTKKIRYVLDRTNNIFLDKLIQRLGKRSIDEFASIWQSDQKMIYFALRSFLRI